MTTVWAEKDERWPDWTIDSDSGYGTAIELTDEELARVRAADTEYNAIQDLIADKVQAALQENKA